MTTPDNAALRATVMAMLAANGHKGPIGEQDSLFMSGRLDSLAAAEMMTLLETEFGLDLTDPDFDITQLDTLVQIEALARRHAA